jgi:hypothetical protein
VKYLIFQVFHWFFCYKSSIATAVFGSFGMRFSGAIIIMKAPAPFHAKTTFPKWQFSSVCIWLSHLTLIRCHGALFLHIRSLLTETMLFCGHRWGERNFESS